jgi:hypothetical protein
VTHIDRRLNNLYTSLKVAYAPATFPGCYPDADHIRVNLTVAIAAHSATGAIAQGLGAVHWAGHSGFTQAALATGLRVKKKPLNQFFHCGKGAVYALITQTIEDRMQSHQTGFQGFINPAQPTGVSH